MVKVIKFQDKQFTELRKVITRDFGNVSLAKGLYIIMYLYLYHTDKNAKREMIKKYYQPFDKRRSNL